jgi:hypothetical protein
MADSEVNPDMESWSDGLRAISEQLAAQGYVAILWHIDDVKQERPDLTDEQAMAVLRKAEQEYNADIGLNWDSLHLHADHLFPPPLKPGDADEPPEDFWVDRDAAFAALDEEATRHAAEMQPEERGDGPDLG